MHTIVKCSQNYEKFKKPLEDATLLVQREKHVSGSMVIPVTLGLKKHLQSVKCDYSTKFVSSLLSSLSKRLSQYENDDVYRTFAIIDTRFKVLWCEAEEIATRQTGYFLPSNSSVSSGWRVVPQRNLSPVEESTKRTS